MTEFTVVYKAFLSKILDDEWDFWTHSELEEDLYDLLMGALPHFKFPRTSLDYNDEGFTADLSNTEIQILATYMKCEWLNRTILTWENVKPLYVERDFSQANLLDKFHQMLETELYNARRLEGLYYRSVNYKSFEYGKLAEN